ncbi:MAG TPA: tetratricopeptide repeat protein [Vicinamibacterales bacterium]|nr:tetratricopeptide repeat protein [Vicinamibacterales bacterium]
MAIDREATLKNAEKFLRVGRLDAAIAEYARVVEDQPKDWNTANALGDLYVRAAQPDKAAGLYRRIAEHLLAEGFYPKAAALFKKVLKITPDDEQAQLRLAEISARQGLMADAKAYYTAIASRRRERGDTAGADEIVVRLGTLDPSDLDARLAAAQAAERGGDAVGASKGYRQLYDAFLEQGREDDALAALRECVRCDPDARDSGILLPLTTLELREGRLDTARGMVAELLASPEAGRAAVVGLGWKLADQHPDAAALCIETAADALIAAGELGDGAALLQEFTTRVPGQLPMLLRLVEVCVDGGLDARMYEAQAQLADAYLAVGKAAEARVIAEDLVGREPNNAAHLGRLRRALETLNVEDIEAVIAACADPRSREIAEGFDDLGFEDIPSEAPPVAGQPGGDAEEPPAVAAARSVAIEHVPVIEPDEPPPPPEPTPAAGARPRSGTDPSMVEIDLTAALGDLERQVGIPEPALPKPPDLEDGFAEIGGEPGSDQDSGEHFELARTYLEMNMPQEAVSSLEMAARSPRYRFAAASMLAQIYRDTSDLPHAIEWLERAAMGPAPGADEGRALMYDLGDLLETVGETARALAVFLELEASSPGYRDIGERVIRLSKGETEG